MYLPDKIYLETEKTDNRQKKVANIKTRPFSINARRDKKAKSK